MICKLCGKNKLSKELLSEALTEKCKHAPLYCYRCVVKILPEIRRCPHPGCNGDMGTSWLDKVDEFKRILKLMFPEYAPIMEIQSSQRESIGHKIIITRLDGEQRIMPYRSNSTVIDLYRWIEENFDCPQPQQKLLFQERELTPHTEDGSVAQLSDFNVQPGATISLLKLLYTIPIHLDEVFFELSWGYPESGKDFLDASVNVFNYTEKLGTMDYRSHNRRFSRQIQHQGDIMDDSTRRGHHNIRVLLHKFPSYVTHIFFTLSARNSSTIANYPRPSLRFYEASDKSKNLCNTTFTHARHSQAVIMCSVSRKSGGPWQIFNSGKLSSGNAYNYKGMNDTMIQMISQGV